MAYETDRANGPCELRSVPCDYCGANEAEVLLTAADPMGTVPGEFNVVVCRRCGLARTDPQPTPETLGLAYPMDYSPHDASVQVPPPPTGFRRWCLVNYRGYPLGRRAPAVVRALLGPLAAIKFRGRYWIGYLPYEGDGRLLDFGCGIGRYVAQMAAAGWKAEGLDPASKAVSAGRRAGLTIHQGTLPGTDLPDGRYDVITMWHALEHVPSPKATLEAARRLLRPGGRLMVVVPRFDSLSSRWSGVSWYGLRLPRHLTHFTTAFLRRHVDAAGFEVKQICSLRRPSFVRETLATLAEDRGSAVLRRLSRWRFPARLLSHISLLARRTDEVVCLARRP